MNAFESSLNQYVLHGAVINAVTINDNSLTFVFDEGVYCLAQESCDSCKTGACNMNLYIQGFDKKSLYQNLTIKSINNSTITDVCFDKFSKAVKNGGFKVYLDYYSFVARSILLIGTTEKFEFEITVTDLEKIEFTF